MLFAVALTTITTLLTIIIHHEAISFLNRWKQSSLSPRTKVVSGVFILFLAHAVEVWLFAATIYIAMNWLDLGTLTGSFAGGWADYLYISIITYSTVGYGDLIPVGYIRTICGFESLTGIMMMAWSASYTVFRLQDEWK